MLGNGKHVEHHSDCLACWLSIASLFKVRSSNGADSESQSAMLGLLTLTDKTAGKKHHANKDSPPSPSAATRSLFLFPHLQVHRTLLTLNMPDLHLNRALMEIVPIHARAPACDGTCQLYTVT